MWVQLFFLSLVAMFITCQTSALVGVGHENTRLNACNCAHYDCGCCEHIEIDFMKVNGTLCADMIYLPNDIGVSLTVTYNKFTVYNETISVRNPPEICPILVEEIHTEACIRFYDIEFDKHHFNGCAEVLISALKVLKIVKIKIGCFHMGAQNSSKILTPYSIIMIK